MVDFLPRSQMHKIHEINGTQAAHTMNLPFRFLHFAGQKLCLPIRPIALGPFPRMPDGLWTKAQLIRLAGWK